MTLSGRSLTPWLAALLTALAPAADAHPLRVPRAAAGNPVFSVWRNLPWTHVYSDLDYVEPDTLDYRHAPPPLVGALADTCCAVRSGQPLTLVRGGIVVGRGRVGALFASREPCAGDSDRAWFSAIGLPDSAGDGRVPPFAAPYADDVPSGSHPDLYVVGEAVVEAYAPKPFVWIPGRDELVAILAEAAERHLIHRTSFPSERWWPEVGGHLPAPDWLPDLLLHEGVLTSFELAIGDGLSLTVQCVRLRAGRDAGDGFVRVAGAGLAEAAYLGGGLAFFLRVDGSPYMLLRNCIPGTGMWGCRVYRLWPDRAPESVLSDGSWSD
jgi:hypothetical protein